MLPELFSIGPLTVHSYGVMLAVAFLLGAWLLRLELRRWHLPEDLADRVAIAGMIGGIAGAKLYFLLVEAPDQFALAPLSMLFSGAGLTFYGGLLGAILLILWVVWRAKVSVVRLADLIGPILVLGYALGRVGCLLSGDGDYGPPTDLPWGISFPEGTVPTTLRVHPTPLYEIILCGIGFAVLWSWLRRKNLPRGMMVGASLVTIGLERFFTEFWRIDSGVLATVMYRANAFGSAEGERTAFRAAVEAHYQYAGLSIAQWISIALFLLGVVILWNRRNAKPAMPPARDKSVSAGTGKPQKSSA